MCGKAWKLHHSNNQMCKDTWIPKDQQTAAVFVLDKVLLMFQWSPSNWKVHFEGQSEGRDMLLFRGWKERAVSSPAPAWALRPPVPPACEQWQHRGKSAAKHVHSTLQEKATAGQGTPARNSQPQAAFRKDQAGSPALGRGAGLALQRALPQLSKGFLLPYGGKLSVLTYSQLDVKGAPARSL